MSAVSARTPSRLEAARRRAEDAKTALAAGAVVLFSVTGVAVAATHPGHQKHAASVQQQTSDELEGGTIAPATSQPQASTSLS